MNGRRYASRTDVSAERSRNEIEKLLMRFGASQFGYMTDNEMGVAHIVFVFRGLRIKISVTMPNPNDERFVQTPTGLERATASAEKEWQMEVKRRWRSLTLLVKAKLIAVDDGVATFEEEFLPYILWGDNRTTAQKLLPKITEIESSIDASGRMPTMLPMPEAEE